MPLPRTTGRSGDPALPAPDGEAASPQVLAAIKDLSLSQSRIEQQLTRIAAALSISPDDGAQPAPEDNHPEGEGQDPAEDDPSELQQSQSWTSESQENRVREVQSTLPRFWPTSIEPRSGFEEEDGDDLLRLNVERGLTSVALRRVSTTTTISSIRDFSCFYAIDPESPGMRLNDVVGVSVLMHDLLVTPFLISWDVRPTGTLLGLAWVSALYWTLDLFLGFVTGVYRFGELMLQQPEVARHYLRTGFAPNCLLLLSDWLGLITSTFVMGESFVWNAGSMLRFFKALRLLKVFRLARLVRLLEKITAGTLSSAIRVGIQVLKVVCSIILLSHLLCCAWHFAGQEGPTDTGLRWPDKLEDFEGNGSLYQYLTSFQWALAQITLGSSDVLPVNWFERLFNIVLLVCGVLFGSTIVAIVSAQFVNLGMERQEQNQALVQLRKFLRQHTVPTSLVVQVTRQASERVMAEKALLEAEVPALQVLSSALRSELLREIRKPHVLCHPLFRLWGQYDMAAVHGLCEEATGFTVLSRRDTLFMPGGASDKAYCVETGRLLYSQFPLTSKVTQETQTDVYQGSWLCEAALWSHWTHVGQLEAVTECQALYVRVDGLMQVLAGHPSIASVTKPYSRRFYARLTSAVPPHAPWPTDIFLPFSASELISRTFSIALLRRAQQAGRLSAEQSDALEEEVRDGLCSLQLAVSSHGDLERVVSLVAVHLEEDGQVFLKVGKWVEGQVVRTDCQLPATKLMHTERPQEALQRLLSTDLSPLMPHIVLEHAMYLEERRESGSTGLTTTYLRTVHPGRLRTPVREISAPMASASDALEVPGLSAAQQRGVYALPCQHHVGLYCWLTPEEQLLLDAPESAAPWEQWLKSLRVSQSSVEFESV